MKTVDVTKICVNSESSNLTVSGQEIPKPSSPAQELTNNYFDI